MADWVAGDDGRLRGYSFTDRALRNTIFFASDGMVDANGVTRLMYPVQTGALNRLKAEIPFTFTAADMAANPGHSLSVAMYLAPASDFPNGTPANNTAIRTAPNVRFFRSDWYWHSIPVSETRTFVINGPAPGTLQPGTKYWVLIMPVRVSGTFGSWSDAEHKPINGFNVNTKGRSVSIWTNRKPEAPVITSPGPESSVAPGSIVTITYDTNDPDDGVPDDPERANRDLAGVLFAARPVPTQENPNPQWGTLPFTLNNGFSQSDSAIYIGEEDGLDAGRKGRMTMLRDLQLKVVVGSDDKIPGHANLPGGDWQIKMRVADFGHPYPLSINPPDGSPGWTMFNSPSANDSPWSEPITIHVLTSTPTPIPLSPRDNRAVIENEPVRLTWRYRNTVAPVDGGPFVQGERKIQIRRVGDEEWTTIVADYSSDSFYDLQPTTVNPPLPAEEYLADGKFMAYNPDWWIDGMTETWATVLSAPEGPSGTRSAPYMIGGQWEVGEFAYYNALLARTILLDPQHRWFEFEGYLGISPGFMLGVVTIAWLDADENEIEETPPQSVGAWIGSGTGAYEWVHIQTGWQEDGEGGVIPGRVYRPDGAVYALVQIAGASADSGYMRLDDVSFRGYPDAGPLGDFTLEATTHYEWRVAARDTNPDGYVWSSYSEPARFWVVDKPLSGDLVPIPSETIQGATLGCGTHTVEVYRRGGKERVGVLTGLTHVDWGRARDDISTSKIVVEDWSLDCGNLLSQLQCWAYEVVIWRDNGYTRDRVWEGPITLLTYEVDKVTIQAKDVMGYAYRRIIKQALNDAGKGNGRTVVYRAVEVLQNAFAPDDPNVLGYLTPLHREDDAMQYRSTPAYSRTAFEEVDDMAANAGLDYTTVGRSILLWGTKHRIGTLPEFRDSDLGNSPIVSEYGMSMANRYAVSDGNGVWGEATRLDENDEDPVYGLVEMLSSTWATETEEDATTYTQEGLQTVIESFESYAEQSISDRYPPPVVVRVPDNTSLSPATPLSIQQLVPGVVIPLRSFGTLRSVVANQKLDSIRVIEEAGKETITVTMSPFSRDDAAIGDAGEDGL